MTTLDVLSGGRAWLGIGAAWHQMWRGDETPYQGKHYSLERPLNSPLPLSQPHPPIMIGGSGEKKTLRMVAKYGDACNLFPQPLPALARQLGVLRAHCDAEGRDYDEITKTCFYFLDIGDRGEKANEIIDQLGQLAGLGFDAVLGSVCDTWKLTELEMIGAKVIPAVASLTR